VEPVGAGAGQLSLFNRTFAAESGLRTYTSAMAKHSKSEREKRAAQNEQVARIEAAWQASVPAARQKEFSAAVAEARARGPLPPPPDMAPGTKPNPPAPGKEPKPKKEPARQRRSSR
jgi:hypothetical protein